MSLSEGDDGSAGFGLAVVWLGAEAEAGEDTAMLVACARNISGIFWLVRPPVSRGEQDLVAELPRDKVLIFSAYHCVEPPIRLERGWCLMELGV